MRLQLGHLSMRSYMSCALFLEAHLLFLAINDDALPSTTPHLFILQSHCLLSIPPWPHAAVATDNTPIFILLLHLCLGVLPYGIMPLRYLPPSAIQTNAQTPQEGQRRGRHCCDLAERSRSTMWSTLGAVRQKSRRYCVRRFVTTQDGETS